MQKTLRVMCLRVIPESYEKTYLCKQEQEEQTG